MRISNVAAITGLDAIAALVDGGECRVYTGSEPGTVEAAETGTLLGTLQLSADAFPGASDGGDKATAVAANIDDDINADDTGDPGYFRLYTSGGQAVIQGSAGGPTGGPFDLTFDKDTFQAGDAVSISNLTLNMPEL